MVTLWGGIARRPTTIDGAWWPLDLLVAALATTPMLRRTPEEFTTAVTAASGQARSLLADRLWPAWTAAFVAPVLGLITAWQNGSRVQVRLQQGEEVATVFPAFIAQVSPPMVATIAASLALMVTLVAIDQWTKADVDAVIITASGCGTTIKDYGHMLRHDAAYAEKAKAISAKAKDVTEFLAAQDLPEAKGGLRLAYHAACSMQHGQKIRTEPQKLLRRAGFTVMDVPEGHLCCGSAGTYNILQPEIAAKLRERKVANIESLQPEAIATGNIGCMTQIGLGTSIPILHTIELLDWAYGGPRPEKLEGHG